MGNHAQRRPIRELARRIATASAALAEMKQRMTEEAAKDRERRDDLATRQARRIRLLEEERQHFEDIVAGFRDLVDLLNDRFPA